MREIDIGGASLIHSKVGDILKLPNRAYRVEGMASGGMGHVIFATLLDVPFNSTISNLPSRVALKLAKSQTTSLEIELKTWSLMMHQNILCLEEILYSHADGVVAASRLRPGSGQSRASE